MRFVKQKHWDSAGLAVYVQVVIIGTALDKKTVRATKPFSIFERLYERYLGYFCKIVVGFTKRG